MIWTPAPRPEYGRETVSGRIEAMEACRELDALVADVVMGWRRSGTFLAAYPRHYSDPALPEHHQETPRFSTDIAAAWLVVERMHARMRDYGEGKTGEPWPSANYLTLLARGGFGVANYGGWAASFCCVHDVEAFTERPETANGALADTAPLAICLASLAVALPSWRDAE